MRKLLIIGIGAGDPEHVTMQAIAALNRTDVFFMLDKGGDKTELLRLKQDICARYIKGRAYRFVEAADPERDRASPAYRSGVLAWHAARAALYETMIAEELPEDGCGAFLVWGDPSLYDSTIRIVEQIATRGHLTVEYEVIPGITSIQALAARHRIPLNRIGESVEITTGRKLSQAMPDSDAVVMLDGDCAFQNIDDDVDIFWGAYIGTPDEILISGRLQDVKQDIVRLRAEARARHGWIMDIYLLRRRTAS